MNKISFKFLEELGDSLRDTFFLPGDFLLSVLAPRLEIIGNNNELLLSVSISMLLWLLLFTVAWKFVKLGRSTARSVDIAVRAHFFLMKTQLACPNKLLMPHKRTSKPDQEIEVEINNLDLAVLSSAATLSQGLVLSAPDLAENLKLQRTEVESSLEKLATNMMLEPALGSTDDYQNYRLTRAGAAFLSMWQRNED